MKGIEPASGGMEEREKLPLVTLPLLLSGVLGLLLLFRSLEGVSYRGAVVYPAACLTCCLLWAAFRRGGVVFLGVFCGLLALYARFAWTRQDLLFRQAGPLIERFTSAPGTASGDLTELALLLGGLLSFLLFLMECALHSHETLYTAVTLLLAFSPALGLKAGFAAVFLLCIFRIAFRVFQMAGRRGRRSLLPAPVQLRLAGRAGLAMCLLLALSFLAAAPLALIEDRQLYAPIYTAEERVTTYLNRLRPESLDTGGHMNRGSSVQNGDAHLILIAGNRPAAPVYLRGFAGGDYTGGNWEAADDASILAGLTDQLPNGDRARDIIDGLFRDMYFFLNQNVDTETEPPVNILEIRNLNGGHGADYAPYYSQKYSDSGSGIRNYWFYEQRDMQVNWERISDPRYGDWYHRLQEAYREAAQETYTRVPRNLVPRLTELAEENPLTGVEEITAFILHTLHSRAAYSLTPGWTPFGADLVEDFLFERGKGYCQHFAAAAALLYRLYGIPARYATGFVVEPSDFQGIRRSEEAVLSDRASLQPGGYTAILTDRSAHAWVEIFLDGYGWTPVEVTPASTESAAGENAFAAFPGFDRLRFLQIGRMRGWDSAEQEAAPQSSSRRSGGLSLLRKPGWQVLAVLFCAAAAVPPLLYWRRRRILERAAEQDCRGAFCRMTELFRFGGLIADGDGEEAVPDRLTDLDSTITREESERLHAAVERAAFGPSGSTPPEDELARSLYERAADTLYSRLSPPKKILFKWWNVFG